MNSQKTTIILFLIIILLVGAVAFLLGEKSGSEVIPVNEQHEDSMMEEEMQNEPGDSEPPIVDEGVPLEGTCSGVADCALGEYCQFANNSCGGVGSCTLKPEICTKQYQPVCGCNDVTYGNSCEAASAGISIAYEGECR